MKFDLIICLQSFTDLLFTTYFIRLQNKHYPLMYNVITLRSVDFCLIHFIRERLSILERGYSATLWISQTTADN